VIGFFFNVVLRIFAIGGGGRIKISRMNFDFIFGMEKEFRNSF